MTLGSNFRRAVTVMIDRNTSPQVAGQHVAAYARSSLADLIRAGASPTYTRFVDGVQGRPEESVRLDGGTISYLFSTLSQAAAYALSYVVERSPTGKTGDFRRGWIIAVDGQPWTAPLVQIPPGSEIILFNVMPYSRKIDVGGQVSTGVHLIEDTRQAVMRRFPGLSVQRMFVTPPSGQDLRGGPVPYVLRGHAIRSGLSFDKRKKIFTRLHAPKRTNRKDAKAGQLLTYPAVVMSERGY